MAFLIAEIGNNHFGNIKKARELIRAAVDCGADLIKGQAFHASDITSGSMPKEFYHSCELGEDECIELVEYARHLGNDMFFSIFSPGFDRLKKVQRWVKFAASQSAKFSPDQDTPEAIVSFTRRAIFDGVPSIQRATALYATEYSVVKEAVDTRPIEYLLERTKGGVGISDHTIGINFCLDTLKTHDLTCIEKHFTLKHGLSWGGVGFRDTVHGADPRELQALAKALQK